MKYSLTVISAFRIMDFSYSLWFISGKATHSTISIVKYINIIAAIFLLNLGLLNPRSSLEYFAQTKDMATKTRIWTS